MGRALCARLWMAVLGASAAFAGCGGEVVAGAHDAQGGEGGAGVTGGAQGGMSNGGVAWTGGTVTGGSAQGGTYTGGAPATGGTGTGAGTSTACLVGNACSTQGSYCVDGNMTCTCINGAWGLCTTNTGGAGTTGTGGTTSTNCAYGEACSTVGTVCISSTYSCTCGSGLYWQSCTTLTGGTTASGTGGTTTGSGGATGVAGWACDGAYGEAQAIPPIIEIVVDNTESMSNTAPSTGGQTKMACTRQALAAAFPRMPANYAVGMTYYHVSSGPCNDSVQAVPIAPMTTAQVTALTDSINTQQQIQMTPSEDAWRFAASYVESVTGLPANYATSNRYVLVLTDGIPNLGQNCAPGEGCDVGVSEAQYQTYIDAAAAAHAAGLSTYVIGMPGSEYTSAAICDAGRPYDPRTKLSQLATAGGTATPGCSDAGPSFCHIDLTDPNIDFVAELTSAIDAITSAVASCRYQLPPPSDPNFPPNYNQAEIRYYSGDSGNYVLLPRNDGCPTPDGWQYTDATYTGIVLCANTCTLVRVDPQARIEMYFGCIWE